MTSPIRSRIWGFAVVAASLAAPAAPAQPAQQERDFAPIVLFESVAPLDMLSHPLDAGLRRALSMAPARLAELPDEIPGYDGPDGETLALVARTLLASAPRVAVVDYGPDPQTGAPGVAALVELRTRGEAQARALHGAIVAALAQAPAAPPVRDAEDGSGALIMDLPFGALRFGPMQGADGAWRYRAALGAVDDEAALFAALPDRPAQGRALVRARLNLAPLLAPALGAMQAMAGQEQPPFLLGALAESLASEFVFVAAQRDDAMVCELRARDIRPAATALGLGEEPLGPEELAIIPADATIASVYRWNLRRQWEMAQSMLAFAPGAEGVLAEFHERTGVDLDADLFGSLGDVAAYYLSDSTGGGGTLSSVVAVRLRDAASVRQALDRLASFANERLAMLPPGDGERSYYRIQRTESGGTTFFGVRFPGLPIPFEPTAAIVGGWLVAGATPQAAMAAVAQASGRLEGDLARALGLFAQARGRSLIGFEFADGSRNVREGYTLTSLLGSMLANGVRSASDAEREPGVVVPPLPILMEGSTPPITQETWWEGDDLVMRCVVPPSMMASTAAMMGAAWNSLGGITGVSAAAGAVLPALGRARGQAQLLRDSAQMRELHLGMTLYASNNNDRYPTDVQTIIDQGLVAPEAFDSPIEWPGDGEGDYFLRLGGEMTFEHDRVMGYSRAAYATGDQINVVFDDNHVELMSIERFHALLRTPKNRGVDWRLPRSVQTFEPNFMRRPPTPTKSAG